MRGHGAGLTCCMYLGGGCHLGAHPPQLTPLSGTSTAGGGGTGGYRLPLMGTGYTPGRRLAQVLGQRRTGPSTLTAQHLMGPLLHVAYRLRPPSTWRKGGGRPRPPGRTNRRVASEGHAVMPVLVRPVGGRSGQCSRCPVMQGCGPTTMRGQRRFRRKWTSSPATNLALHTRAPPLEMARCTAGWRRVRRMRRRWGRVWQGRTGRFPTWVGGVAPPPGGLHFRVTGGRLPLRLRTT